MMLSVCLFHFRAISLILTPFPLTENEGRDSFLCAGDQWLWSWDTPEMPRWQCPLSFPRGKDQAEIKCASS